MTNEQANGVLAGISEKLIRVLPPAFILLIIMNIMFLGVVTWVVNHNLDQRNAMLSKIIDKCVLQRNE